MSCRRELSGPGPQERFSVRPEFPEEQRLHRQQREVRLPPVGVRAAAEGRLHPQRVGRRVRVFLPGDRKQPEDRRYKSSKTSGLAVSDLLCSHDSIHAGMSNQNLVFVGDQILLNYTSGETCHRVYQRSTLISFSCHPDAGPVSLSPPTSHAPPPALTSFLSLLRERRSSSRRPRTAPTCSAGPPRWPASRSRPSAAPTSKSSAVCVCSGVRGQLSPFIMGDPPSLRWGGVKAAKPSSLWVGGH